MHHFFTSFSQNLSHHKNLFRALTIGFAVFALAMLFVITRGANPHTSELAFTEHSTLGKEAGSVIPASAESNPPPVTCTTYTDYSSDVVNCQTHTVSHSYQHCSDNTWVELGWTDLGWSGQACPVTPTITWTQYCTGPNDVNNPNQIWEYSNESPASYRSTGGTCAQQPPAVVWTQYCTGPNDINGNNYQIWEYDNQSPQTYRNTGGTCTPPTLPSGCGIGTLNDTCPNPILIWTQYCTGPNDPNGYNYQIWEYSNQNPAVYRSTGGTCVPTPPPTIYVNRTPSDGYVGDTFHMVWSATNATSFGYACTGGFNASDPNETLTEDYTDVYQDAWYGTTNCIWTATGPGGTTQLPETFIVRRSVCYPEVCSISTCPSGTFWNGTTCETGCGSNNSCPPVSSNNILLSATPKTLANPGNVTLSFSITSPTTKCAIRAVPYITDDPTHQAARNADASAISSLFFATTTTKTDLNDPYNGPSFSSGRTLSKAFSQADPVTNDGKARGKKTVQVNYSTLFQMSCDNWSTMKSQLVQLTKEKEI